jgi:hypothetical protein
MKLNINPAGRDAVCQKVLAGELSNCPMIPADNVLRLHEVENLCNIKASYRSPLFCWLVWQA